MISTNSNSSVLALGELLWDVLPSERLLGGAPANFCYRLRQLGVPALIVSRVGQDALGDELLAGLSEKNFDLSLVQRDPSFATGTVDVILTAEGNPSFTINKTVAYDFMEATPELLSAASGSALMRLRTRPNFSTLIYARSVTAPRRSLHRFDEPTSLNLMPARLRLLQSCLGYPQQLHAIWRNRSCRASALRPS